MTIGICRWRRSGFEHTSCLSSFSKSYVYRKLGPDPHSIDDGGEGGSPFLIEPLAYGIMLMGTCLGLRLEKPASLVEPYG